MEQFVIILGIIWLAIISPGADFAMVSRVSFMQGREAGLMAAVGIATACWFHVAYAMFGLGFVQQLFPQFLEVLKLVGAAYLIYIGVTTIGARSETVNAAAAPGSAVRALATGVLTNGLNPKTAIFIISLYAQVIGPATPLSQQLGYGALISVSHFAWFALVALFLSRPDIRSRVLAYQGEVNGAIGVTLVLLGIALAVYNLNPSYA